VLNARTVKAPRYCSSKKKHGHILILAPAHSPTLMPAVPEKLFASRTMGEGELFYVLNDHSLKQELSIVTTFDPC
jgi:hypothetical protein